MSQPLFTEKIILEKKQAYLKARDMLISAIATKEELVKNEKSIIDDIKGIGLDPENLDKSIDDIVNDMNTVFQKINEESTMCDEIFRKMV